MKEKLEIGFINRLTNDEFPQLVLKVTAVLEEKQLEGAQNQAAFARLNAHSEALKQVVNSSKFHPLTELIVSKSKERKRHIMALIKKIDANINSAESSSRDAATTLSGWIHAHRKGFYKLKSDKHSRLIFNMNEELQLSSDFAAALTSLSLKKEFEAIVAETQVIEQLFLTRSNEIADARKRPMPIREKVYEDLSNMLRALELSGYMGSIPAEEYAQLVERIKEILVYYRQNVRLRATNRRKAKENLLKAAKE